MANITPMKAIRAYCIECSNNSAHEVQLCPMKDCPLYAFRLGKNPNIAKRELTDEQKAVLTARLANYRP